MVARQYVTAPDQSSMPSSTVVSNAQQQDRNLEVWKSAEKTANPLFQRDTAERISARGLNSAVYIGECDRHGLPKRYGETEEEIKVFKKSHSGCGHEIALF